MLKSLKTLLCKISHNWSYTFSVLTDHYPSIRRTKTPKAGRYYLGDSFYEIRTCKNCGLEQTNRNIFTGHVAWIGLDDAKELIKEWNKDDFLK